MDEALEWAKILHDSPNLFPWVVLIIILLVIFKERDFIRELFQSIINAKKETSIYHAQHNELVRNNTAALENNTAALEMVRNEHDRIAIMLDNHEMMSKERMEHIQTILDRVDTTVSSNQRNIALITDRTDKW